MAEELVAEGDGLLVESLHARSRLQRATGETHTRLTPAISR
jgi:hypothetical protein